MEGYSQENLVAFKNQDYSTIDLLLSQDVTVKINKSDKVIGKQAGLAAIKTMLQAFNPIKIETRHRGRSAEQKSDYQIAKLINTDGAVIRMFIHFENSASGRKICDVKLRSL